MTPIETDRLILRNFAADDWPALHQMIVGYQQSPYARYDHPWPTEPEKIREVAEWFAGGDRYLAVCLKESGTFIGFVCLNPGEHEGVMDLGYVFDADYHGQGYATEAGRAALARAFEVLGVDRVVSGTAKENLPSCRLLERLGLRQTAEGPVWVISREEWKRRHS